MGDAEPGWMDSREAEQQKEIRKLLVQILDVCSGINRDIDDLKRRVAALEGGSPLPPSDSAEPVNTDHLSYGTLIRHALLPRPKTLPRPGAKEWLVRGTIGGLCLGAAVLIFGGSLGGSLGIAQTPAQQFYAACFAGNGNKPLCECQARQLEGALTKDEYRVFANIATKYLYEPSGAPPGSPPTSLQTLKGLQQLDAMSKEPGAKEVFPKAITAMMMCGAFNGPLR